MAGSGWNPNPVKDLFSASHSPDSADEQSPRILIIEDNKTDVFLIREALELAGVNAHVQIAADGHAAIEMFEAVNADQQIPCPSLILLDMNLPKRSGHEVLNHLRRSARCNTSPVIIVSSSDAPRDRASVAELAIAGYFKKPSAYLEFMRLGHLVKEVLKSREP